ncbi:carboxypeptidase N subunit 2-like [Prorops nasuta]|uniref:carboxypeptidase N subunit 2-like n=1 Tax=Prorops nasuta TaxID=863751 RepID=UPI0034CD795D
MASRGPLPTTLPIAIAMAAMLAMANAGFCPSRCRCDDENLRASCIHADLDIVPIQLNPEIRQLDLSNNRIDNIGMNLGFYGNLDAIDLSSNALTTLGSNDFDFQQNLMKLNVSNNAISNIPKRTFHNLKALKYLDLSNNNITDLDPQTFKFTSNLETLNLSGNSITSLAENLLENLHRIRILLLRRNSLLEVPSGNLATAPSLEIVDLSDNLIQELNRSYLPSLPSLITLNLANNVIKSISDGAFDGLPSLLHLDLSRNNLTSVPTPALARLTILSSLILSRNPLKDLHEVAFRDLFELRSLELDNCTISSVHARAFSDNINLERISMDGNHKLTKLPSRVLYGARYLKVVSLRRCNLASLQPTHFPVDSLSILRVGSNPLVCNCSAHWLWNVIRAEERRNNTRLELDSSDIKCVDEEFSGKLLLTLPESSLRCRLSPLYLSLSAAGCLAATATILALIAHLTRAKRKKRLAYATPNRPEFLVYVGKSNSELDKNAGSYSKRLLVRNDNTYDTRRKVLERSPQDTNIYEIPRFGNIEEDRETLPGRTDPALDGVYAVADVTNLRREPPEVLSLYRVHSPSELRNSVPRLGYGYERDHEYEYGYDYERGQEPAIRSKPHVVFV